QAEDGIRFFHVTGVQTCALPISARRPFDDFEVNAVGTLNLLEAARRYVPESPFVFMSTNKVYGDAPNEVPLRELETRWDYADPRSEERRVGRGSSYWRSGS